MTLSLSLTKKNTNTRMYYQYQATTLTQRQYPPRENRSLSLTRTDALQTRGTAVDQVWPVTEIVTYGFDPAQAPLDKRGE